MSILSRLATSFNRRDEEPNIELAKHIAKTKNKKAILELIENLSNKNKGIRYDYIKTLYEVGKLNPSLIAEHYNIFLELLKGKDNRMQWGAMTALNTIVQVSPMEIHAALPVIMDAAGEGSVITKDNAVAILVSLAGEGRYANNALDLLHEQILTSLPNQLPMYAEKALPVIDEKNKARFIKALTSRLRDIEKESKRTLVETVIRKLKKIQG